MNTQSSTTHLMVQPNILYYGNTVVLLSTKNPDGSTNIAPMSSAWALGNTIVLGIGLGSRTADNLAATGEAVLNLPGPELFKKVDVLGNMTGADHPRSQHGRGSVRKVDKFAAVGLTPQTSTHVSCDRIRECKLQIEVEATDCQQDVGHEFLIVQAQVLQVHAAPEIVVAGTSHIDPTVWKPLVYNFRHYHTLTSQIGESSVTETPTHATIRQ